MNLDYKGPLARNTDPDESFIAALKASKNLSTRRAQVLHLVLTNPFRTSGELSRIMIDKYPDLPVRVAAETPHKRLPELEVLGHVERAPSRKCTDSGYIASTWCVSSLALYSSDHAHDLDWLNLDEESFVAALKAIPL